MYQYIVKDTVESINETFSLGVLDNFTSVFALGFNLDYFALPEKLKCFQIFELTLFNI